MRFGWYVLIVFIVLIGNAPLSLARISRYVLEEGIRPALIVGMPVGFVNVVESKLLTGTCPVPQIVLDGRRGGSALAVTTLQMGSFLTAALPTGFSNGLADGGTNPLFNSSDISQLVMQVDANQRFIPEPASMALLGLGMAGLEAFLERRRGLYDVLWISRPPNLQALAPLRARRPELFAGMRLIYDSEALFALREIGELAVKGRPLTPAQAQARLDAELALAQDLSQVVVVSQRDAQPFRERGHPVSILSHAMPVRRSVPGPKRRAGLVFVGALHPDTPNEDGLLWFVEQVLPRLRARPGGAPVLEVVGECRSPRIAALASAEVRVLGAQADLRPCYDRARVFIAPVRFAGGVPVKVIEAAAQGIPVVASAILQRQLGWQDGRDIQGARDAEAFARAIAHLLDDDAHWQAQQAAAWARCEADYHPDDFARQVHRLLLGEPTQEHA